MNTILADDKSGAAILDRVIRPDEALLSTEAARVLLSLKFDQSDERRMNRLAAKSRKGTLTDDERAEAEQYNLISHLVALLQAKAHGALNQNADALT